MRGKDNEKCSVYQRGLNLLRLYHYKKSEKGTERSIFNISNCMIKNGGKPIIHSECKSYNNKKPVLRHLKHLIGIIFL